MNNDDERSKHAAELVRQVWCNKFAKRAALYPSWDPLALGIDESLAEEIVCSLHPFPEDMAAALDWWRNQMVATIDEVVRQFKNDPRVQR
jgi:hypothetical protein